MTTIIIVILDVCLAICWYTIIKRNKEIEKYSNMYYNEYQKNVGLEFENKRIIADNIELHKREDKLIEQWAEITCERTMILKSIFNPKTVNGKQYKMYKIEGIEIKAHFGTAGDMWELYNSNKEVYTKYDDAKAELKKKVEKALAYEEEKTEEENNGTTGI